MQAMLTLCKNENMYIVVVENWVLATPFWNWVTNFGTRCPDVGDGAIH